VRIQKREAALVRAEVLQCSVWGCALYFFFLRRGRARQTRGDAALRVG